MRERPMLVWPHTVLGFRWLVASLLLAAFAVAGCTLHDSFVAEFIAIPSSRWEKADGRVLIVADKDAVTTYEYPIPTHYIHRLILPTGIITQEAARGAFGGIFKEGAEAARSVEHAQRYRTVVRVTFASFSYAEKGGTVPVILPFVGLRMVDARTALVSVSIAVEYLDTNGEPTARGVYGGVANVRSDDPSDANLAAHAAVRAAMTQAAAELRRSLFPPFEGGISAWVASIADRKFDEKDFSNWVKQPVFGGDKQRPFDPQEVRWEIDAERASGVPVRVQVRPRGNYFYVRVALASPPPGLSGADYQLRLVFGKKNPEPFDGIFRKDGYVLADKAWDKLFQYSLWDGAALWVGPPPGNQMVPVATAQAK